MDRRAPVDLATADGHDRYVPSDTRDIVSAGHEGVYEWAARNLVREGTRVLDLGCGAGYGADVLTAAGASFDGVDGSPVAVEHAQARYAGPNARFFVADLMSPLPVEIVPKSYDVVFSSEVLEHVVDPFAFVRTMAGFVRDDGTCFVGTPNRLFSLERMPRGQLLASSHVMEFTPAALLALLGTQFDDISLLYRMLPEGAVSSIGLPVDRPRLVRAVRAFVREMLPTGWGRFGNGLGRRRQLHEWSPEDIAWLRADDPQLDMRRCVGLAAQCRVPRGCPNP
jgi:SAM-dependent methyltransferase